MRIFVCGDQEPEYIQETMDYLNDNHNITEICGSATSRCMDVLVPWADENKIRLTLYLPEDISVPGMIAQNAEIIKKESPFAVLIYVENARIVDSLIQDAADSDSVQYIIRQDS